ncbi:MAG TPA: tetratricopeptide repeat protein, partial [Saprospiraceae bacterium]|nr:tetratricopeptide repeat protein [Saprospiraceae bacterium]
MKSIFGLIVMLNLFQQLTLAQQNTIDSLLTLLKRDKEDTSKVNHLNALAGELMRSNPDSAILLSKNAMQLAVKMKWNTGIGRTYNELGWYYYMKGDYSMALENYNKALEIWEKLFDQHVTGEALKGKADAFRRIGSVYRDQGNYSQALDFYFKALQLDEELSLKAKIA